MDSTGLTRRSVYGVLFQGKSVERRGLPGTVQRCRRRSLGGLSRSELKRLRCEAAAEPEVASPADIEAAVSGEQASPTDPAGTPIKGESSSQPNKAAKRTDRSGGSKIEIKDLKVGNWYEGTVVSIQPYGAFFDIGPRKHGLCFLREMSEGFVSKASDIVTVGEKRRVRVMGLDVEKGRIDISLLEPGQKEKNRRPPGAENGVASGAAEGSREARGSRGGRRGGRGGGRGGGSGGSAEKKVAGGKPKIELPDVAVAQKITGKVVKVERFGVFVQIQEGRRDALLTGNDINGVSITQLGFSEGQEIEAYVRQIDTARNNLTLTLLSPEEQKRIKQFNQKGTSSDAKAPKAASSSLKGSHSALGAALQRAGISAATPAASPTKAEEKPSTVEKEQEVPEAVKDVSPDPAAIPAVELATEAQPAAKAAEAPAEPHVPLAADSPPAEIPEPTPEAAEVLPAAETPAEISSSQESTSMGATAAESPEATPQAIESPAVGAAATESSVPSSPIGDTSPAAENSTPEPAAERTPPVVKEPAPASTVPVVEEQSSAEATAQVTSTSTEAPSSPLPTEAPSSPLPTEATSSPLPAVGDTSVDRSTEAKEQSPVEEAVAAATSAKPAAAEKKGKGKKTAKAQSASSSSTGGAISATAVKELREKTGAGMMDCKNALKETSGDVDAAVDFLRKKGLASADKKAGRSTTEGLIASYIHAGSGLGVLIEVNCETDFVARGEIFTGLCNDLAMQIAAFGDVVAVSGDDVPKELLDKEREIEMGKDDILSKPEDKRAMIVEGRIAKTRKRMSLLDQPYIKDNSKNVETFIKETIAQLGENITVRRFERFVLGEGIEKKQTDLAKEVEEQTKKMQEAAEAKATQAKEEAPAEPTEEQVASLQVSAKVVKELRQASGAGMMDCKRALAACDGDMGKAADYLRKKGLASADKKAGRIASEGAVASYIHAGRLGVLVEVNCETDFVARGDVFQELAADMAMQIASNAQVVAVTKEEFPQEELERERRIAMDMDDIKSKPENIREKIVEGRVGKIASERALLEQQFIKDTKKTVGQHIKETIAALGENIAVRRFVRFNLGEGLQKKQENFAEEIAKATGQA